MNDFIQLRKKYSSSAKEQQFPLAYLNKFEARKKATKHEQKIADHLEIIFRLQQKEQLSRQDMFELQGYLGKNDYLDAYIVTLFIKNKPLFKNEEFGQQIKKQVLADTVADTTVFALLDSCIESKTDWFSEKILLELLEKETLSLDTFSMIIDYLYHFKKEGFKEEIINWLEKDYPITIKLQLIDLFVEIYPDEAFQLEEKVSLKEQKAIINYLNSFQKEPLLVKGLTILQSMFYGDFDNSGKGNNGGLAIFLKSLGKELAKSEDISGVITLALTNEWTAKQSLVTEYSTGHLFVQLPMFIDKTSATAFLKKENLIKRTVTRYLDKLMLEPDIYHVRFLDNASRAVARLSKEQDKKLVVTLTPDPHRNMTTLTGSFRFFTFDRLIENLNKILIGDELIIQSDKIVGIGRRVVHEELEKYFPELKWQKHRDKVKMISEGIQTERSLLKQEGKKMTTNELEKLGITQSFLARPIILNVGRLNQLKAQDQLLVAWIHSDLSKVYNLLIIGGDLEYPDAEERQMIDAFNKQLAAKPHLADHFLHLGALSNDQIRTLEKKIRAKQGNLPQIYLCSSQKEEFGIAILEALAQGFLVLGPKKGGVKSYLQNGINGFLIDTTNWQTIAKATEEIVHRVRKQENNFEKIQQAGQQTVVNNFSITAITEDFLSLYFSLQAKE